MPLWTWSLATANRGLVLNPKAQIVRQRSMSHAHHSIVESLWVFVALSLVAIAYLHRWMRVAWLVPDGVESWRAWSFFVGLLLTWVGLGSPLSALDHDLLTVHMIQHLLLMTVAPPLILLGEPLKLLPQRPVKKLGELVIRLPRTEPMREPGRDSSAPDDWLDWSHRHSSCVAYSFDIYAWIEIANVAWDRASFVSRDRISFLVASG